MPSSDRPIALFRLPPPMLFGLAFALGSGLQHLTPLPTHPAGRVLFALGAVLLGVALVCGAALAIGFLARRTTLNPFGRPTTFVASGLYAFSRNPMYLTLIAAYAGGALMLGSIWPLATLAGPLAILSRVVIPREEASMRSQFGQAYRDYCTRVRRWL